MTLMDNAYLNPPVDANLYLSAAQSVTADAYSTVKYDTKAAGCFPMSAALVIEPFTVGTGESITITARQSANADMSSPDDIQVVGSYTAGNGPTEQVVVPLSNFNITKRYFALYYDVSSGDTIPLTAYLTLGA